MSGCELFHALEAGSPSPKSCFLCSLLRWPSVHDEASSKQAWRNRLSLN